MQPIQMIFIYSDGSIQALDLSVPMNLSVFVPVEDTYSVVASSLVSDVTIQFGEGTKEEMNALLLLIAGLKGNIGQQLPNNQGFGGYAPPMPNPFMMGPKTVIVRTLTDHRAASGPHEWRGICVQLAQFVPNTIPPQAFDPRFMGDELVFAIL